MKHLLFINFLLSFSLQSQVQILVQRTEYEVVNEVIYDINDPLEDGTIAIYSITSGNTDDYYKINSKTGKLKMKLVIDDVFDVVQTDALTVSTATTTYEITIVDAYDYFMSTLDASYTVMSLHNEAYIDSNAEWTAINNLWGKGSAEPNVDFRIATIYKTDVTDTPIFIWDVPSKASDYGGASVWCYNNILWGNRINTREDLMGFPFKISSIDQLTLDFDFENLFGDDDYKIAMNMFMTDEEDLTAFSNNDGDFFMTFDQNGTYVPPYPEVLPDTTILGKNYRLLYDPESRPDTHPGYERRRAIILNNEQLLQGTIDVEQLFTRFQDENWLDQNQSIANIQLGIEVTDGFGAVRVNSANINMSVLAIDDYLIDKNIAMYPNPASDIVSIKGNNIDVSNIHIFNILGQEVTRNIKIDQLNPDTIQLNINDLKEGIYIIKSDLFESKLIKK